MQTITTIGLDIAKSVFQVHGVDPAGSRRPSRARRRHRDARIVDATHDHG
jgi:hypothetical protein